MSGRSLKSILKGVLWHPLMPIAVFVWVSFQVEEWYPFTNYPMYGNPTEKPLAYYYLVDAATGDPIRAQRVVRTTASKVGKVYKRELKKRQKKAGIEKAEIPDAMKAEAGRVTLEYLRTRARPEEAPEKLRIMEVLITTEGEELLEAVRVIADEG